MFQKRIFKEKKIKFSNMKILTNGVFYDMIVMPHKLNK